MKRIGLLADTHNYLDHQLFSYFEHCDELWHAGDFGEIDLVDRLSAFKPLKGVYGNIDGGKVRERFSKDLRFSCESVNVFMTHIGGYPGKYESRVRKILYKDPPDIYVCGHSHILKIMRDKNLGNMLHINPGAAGHQCFHKTRTAVRFAVDRNKIKDVEIIELGKRKSS